MSAPAIRVRDIGKEYKLGLRANARRSFGEALVHLLGAPVRQWRSLGEKSDGRDLFWALRDVSFDVRPGEVVGIIGRNGAGKSTLLKILSRVVHPTTGRAEIRGRVGSLLEVGTGFHPELTGRENIFLNGAILGMKHEEIRRKFDEIVAFSEIEKFLDTPVKRYSSGMYVRLAFAVAAHLEPEVLIVDEVLAVGDAQFQRKCLGKMGAVSRQGRTVLFVSHNLTAVRILCPRAICLCDGRVVQDGDAAAVVQNYLAEDSDAPAAPDADLCDWPTRKGSGEARIVQARLLDASGRVSGVFHRLGPMSLEFTLESRCRSRLNLSAAIATADDGIKVLQLAHQDSAGFSPGVVDGRRTVRIGIPTLPLQCGDYHWHLAIHTEALEPVDCVFEVLRFRVEDDLTRSPRPYRSTREHGLCSLPARWEYVNPGERRPSADREEPADALQPL
jgi:lipopolysaccharide transport system ATP-binding protein